MQLHIQPHSPFANVNLPFYHIRMLEAGFESELTEIISNTPKSRQTMLFSATMTDNVDDLIRLSLHNPIRLFIDSTESIASRLTQEFVRVRKEEFRASILLSLCERTYKTQTIVFFRAKKTAHEMAVLFTLLGHSVAELHGDLSQLQRLDALESFRDGSVRYLFATDLAARGLDIKGVKCVVNFDMPANYSLYVHRVGRTARGDMGGRYDIHSPFYFAQSPVFRVPYSHLFPPVNLTEPCLSLAKQIVKCSNLQSRTRPPV